MKYFLFILAFLFNSQAYADEIYVAVASNFTATSKAISELFEKETGHKVKLSFGSTGKFYAQILNGAPFQVFLAADDKHPQKLAQSGDGIPETLFTYATGKLVLWSLRENPEQQFKKLTFRKLAIANPETAPYGTAAVEALKSMKLWEQVESKIVKGDNISQTQQFVSTGNAEIGFIALAQAMQEGYYWEIPQELYSPLRQQAILLKKGSQSTAAKAFLEFLKTPIAIALITKAGYVLE
jgi:molybdate transport system substrate-binding protein